MLRLASTTIAALVLLLTAPFASAQTATPLPGFNVDVRETSVSGLSSGGFMAVQFDVAFSSFVKGAGIVAGGPYYCARGDVQTATSVCSCVPFGCFMPGMIDTPSLIRITDQNAGRGLIDPVANLARHRIWLFSGTADTAVPPRVMNELDTYYRNYIDPSQIAYENRIPAEHAQPTDDFGNACGTRADPYINDCDYDGAGQLLRWIYGPLSPRNDGALSGSFVQFDQTEFLANPTSHGMDTTGWAYVPAACREDEPCRLHVVFHGCQQYQSRRYFQPGAGMTTFGTTYVRNTGYNEWADTNNFIVLYPQAISSSGNPNGCWDWWGYDDPNYALKSGRQMAAVKGMVDRVTGGFVSLPAPAGLRVTGHHRQHGDAELGRRLGCRGLQPLPERPQGERRSDRRHHLHRHQLGPGDLLQLRRRRGRLGRPRGCPVGRDNGEHDRHGTGGADTHRLADRHGGAGIRGAVLDGSCRCRRLRHPARHGPRRPVRARQPSPGLRHHVRGCDGDSGHDLLLRRPLGQRVRHRQRRLERGQRHDRRRPGLLHRHQLRPCPGRPRPQRAGDRPRQRLEPEHGPLQHLHRHHPAPDRPRRLRGRHLPGLSPGESTMPVPAPFGFFWPLSGDVTQAWATWARMVGQWGLININVGGDSTPDPVLERRIVDEVASYGRQLGRISEALEALIEATVTEEAADGQRLDRSKLKRDEQIAALLEFRAMLRQIEAVKTKG